MKKMGLFILPDNFPMSEWMFAYCIVITVFWGGLYYIKKPFLQKYVIFIITAIISIDILIYGYKIDTSPASNGARFKLNHCAIESKNKDQMEVWFNLTQHHASSRYEVYRQLHRCKLLMGKVNENK